MTLSALFSKDPTRPIDGVIKADDRAHLAREVREYVITDDIRRKLHDNLLEKYVRPDDGKTNGAWISGFFGSGKSHLLKMLSLVLPNRELSDEEGSLRAGDHFLEKASEDAMLRGILQKAITIPSESILFNIDSVGSKVGKGGSGESAVLSAFLKVFNEHLGYFGQHPYIAQIERDLDAEGMLDTFKDHYRELNGIEWEVGRTRTLLGAKPFEAAFAKTRGIEVREAQGKLKEYRDHTVVNIETFARLVSDYLEARPGLERLNFFVDEVGQYISDDTKLMTNLQTVAEDLYTATRGRAWVFVTSQQAIDKLIGDLKKTQEQDFSKIQGRFGCKLTLDSKSVNEVVERRLLSKTDDAAERLRRRYDEELETKLANALAFTDGGSKYTGYEDADHFARVFPFVPYQFDLFKRALEQLSRQRALLGLHISVGERSLLGAAQDVLKARFAEALNGGRDGGADTLVGFDRMYAGIESAVRTEASGSLQTADKTNLSPLAKRALRALFLVKFVSEFKSTLRHVSVLLYEDPAEEFGAHQKAVSEALAELEDQNFIQRKGANEFEFLTQEEQVVEREIKEEAYTTDDLVEALRHFVFDMVLTDRKYVYSANKRSYPVNRMFDDRAPKVSNELTVHVTSPFYPQADDRDEALRTHAANTQGRPELRIVMAPDDQLRKDLTLHYQTERYLSKNPPKMAGTKQKTRILEDQGSNNDERRYQVRAQVERLLAEADILVSGTRGRYAGTQPKERVAEAFDDLVRTTYRELDLVKIGDPERELKDWLLSKPSDLFTGEQAELSAAESTVPGQINAIRQTGSQVTLARIVEEFGRKPYGWPAEDTVAVVGRLAGRARLDVLVNGEELSNAEAYERLSKSSGRETVQLRPQDVVDARQQMALKRLHKDLFDEGNPGVDVKQIREAFKAALERQLAGVEALLGKTGDYPFVDVLASYRDALEGFSRKQASEYFGQVRAMEDALLDAREEVLRPLEAWFAGSGRKLYDEAKALLKAQRPNAEDLAADATLAEVEALVAHERPYHATAMRGAEEKLRTAKHAIAERLRREREETKRLIREELAHVQASSDWADLDEGLRGHFRDELDARARQAEDKDTIAAIQRLQPARSPEWFASLTNRISEAAAKRRTPAVAKVMNLSAQVNDSSTPAAAPKPSALLSSLLRSRAYSRLSSEAEVEGYLDELRGRLLKAVREGSITVR